MRRAAVSIGSNISEGEWRWQTRDGIRFFQIAMGSAAELRFQAGVCERNALVPGDESKVLVERCDHIIAKLNKLICARLKRLEESEGKGR
jgi:four helix bundle protein